MPEIKVMLGQEDYCLSLDGQDGDRVEYGARATFDAPNGDIYTCLVKDSDASLDKVAEEVYLIEEVRTVDATAEEVEWYEEEDDDDDGVTVLDAETEDAKS